MQFRGFVRVFNKSGEEYEDAQVSLIVGTINLVEKIAELARRRGIPVPASEERSLLKQEAARASFARASAGSGLAKSGAKAIVKEGLSEYFMFTVEGTETIPNGWSKRMRAVRAEDLKFDIVYRQRAYQYGPRPVRFFIWHNDEEHKLSASPLPNGLIRVFRDNGREGLAYLGQRLIRYVPVKAKIEVNLGPDDLVVYETQQTATERLNFHFRRVNNKEVVDGWDEKTRWTDTVRNYRTKPIVFELRRRWDGDVDYYSEVATTLFDYRTTQATFSVPQRGKKEYPATVVRHHDVNAKQKRINLLKDAP